MHNRIQQMISLIKENNIRKLEKIFTLTDLEIQDEYRKTFLDWACFLGNQAVLDLVYKKVSSNISFYSPYDYFTLLRYSIDCKQPFLKIKEYHLHYLPIIQKYNPHLGNDELLHIAAKRGDLEVITFLIDQGANVNSKCDVRVECYSYSLTPIYTAASYGYVELVKLLIKKGAEVNVCSSITPLEIASLKGHTEIISILFNAMLANYIQGYKDDPYKNYELFKGWRSEDWKDVAFLSKIIQGEETNLSKIRDFIGHLELKSAQRIKALARMSDYRWTKWNNFLCEIGKQVMPYLLKLEEQLSDSKTDMLAPFKIL